MRGRYQGGSLAGFVVIGVILTLVFVGGLYGLNRYNAEQSKEVATQTKPKKDSNDTSKDDQAAKPQPGTGVDSSSDEASNNSNTSSTDAAHPGASNEATANDSRVAAALPATGPADVVGMLLGAVALGYSGALYIQSRSYRSR